MAYISKGDDRSRMHDPQLIDVIAGLPREQFSGEVFRATRLNADPTAFSNNGGRWAPSSDGRYSVQVLYTSLARDGALAEVASYLSLLIPLPSKPLCVHRLRVTTTRTLRIVRADFGALGIIDRLYSEREYARTQEIGAIVSFLECDGRGGSVCLNRLDGLISGSSAGFYAAARSG
ncbi:RES family NAD+ phosphorylase [Aurantimonas sp. A3-2-R12]|uniref:RES family NAD+ phosphorylase n=1 Tax=Aurantimonas sp. A3-2-R12 TaxID=3114362 RepID=UPI002E19BA2E|nr:RES family NAD+ phosphorylase [Aurantimonas sp. A3-2-R12]